MVLRRLVLIALLITASRLSAVGVWHWLGTQLIEARTACDNEIWNGTQTSDRNVWQKAFARTYKDATNDRSRGRDIAHLEQPADWLRDSAVLPVLYGEGAFSGVSLCAVHATESLLLAAAFLWLGKRGILTIGLGRRAPLEPSIAATELGRHAGASLVSGCLAAALIVPTLAWGAWHAACAGVQGGPLAVSGKSLVLAATLAHIVLTVYLCRVQSLRAVAKHARSATIGRLCGRCRYPLAGIAVCPECGTPRATIHQPRPRLGLAALTLAGLALAAAIVVSLIPGSTDGFAGTARYIRARLMIPTFGTAAFETVYISWDTDTLVRFADGRRLALRYVADPEPAAGFTLFIVDAGAADQGQPTASEQHIVWGKAFTFHIGDTEVSYWGENFGPRADREQTTWRTGLFWIKHDVEAVEARTQPRKDADEIRRALHDLAASGTFGGQSK